MLIITTILRISIFRREFCVYYTGSLPITDDQGLLDIITENKDYFLNLPPGQTITILLDKGYHKDYLEKEISKIDPQLRDKIDIQISDKITPITKPSFQKVVSSSMLPNCFSVMKIFVFFYS